MRRLSLLLALCSCDAVVGELGEAEAPPSPVAAATPRIQQLDCTPITGDEPLMVTCTLVVTHPENKPVSCSIDPGDGSPAKMVPDCLNPQMVQFTFANPGAFTLKILASDPDLGHVNETVPITVNVRANQPPVIDDFTASPAMGGAPFTSTLTWHLTDPEGDTLTCKVDGVTVDCSMPFSQTVTTVGTTTVTLTVTDSHGGTTTKTVTLTAVMPVGDVRISKVEWGQTVVLTDLRLVAQKPALLRVHVLGDKANFMGVTVEATGKLGTTDLGKVTLTGPPSPPTAEVPADLTKQWTATLPANWIDTGLEVTVKIDAADALPETDEANNVQVLKPAVGKANVMQLTAVPVVHQGTMPTITQLEGPLTRVWPLKGVDQQTRAPYTTNIVLTGSDTNAWGNLLDDILQLRSTDGSSRNYYAFVKVSYGSGVAGIGYIGQESAVGRDDSIETAQHELGHNMGRQHAPCGGVAGPDPGFPYAGAKIGSWGYDAVAKRLMNPATYVDLMSYCSPEWISDYNYKRVQTYLEAQPNILGGGTSSPFMATVAVSGRFGHDGIVLRPVHRVRAQLPAELPYSDHSVRVRYVNGSERVVPVRLLEIADTAAPEWSFATLVEDLGAIASVALLDRGTVVHEKKSLRLPEGAPRVEAVRSGDSELTLKWDAERYPYLGVAQVTEGGRTTLALGLTGGVARISIAGAEEGHLELSLSDGVEAARHVQLMPRR